MFQAPDGCARWTRRRSRRPSGRRGVLGDERQRPVAGRSSPPEKNPGGRGADRCPAPIAQRGRNHDRDRERLRSRESDRDLPRPRLRSRLPPRSRLRLLLLYRCRAGLRLSRPRPPPPPPTLRTLTACSFPFRSSYSILNSTVSPSRTLPSPSFNDRTWQKRSAPPSSGAMNPNPRSMFHRSIFPIGMVGRLPAQSC